MSEQARIIQFPRRGPDREPWLTKAQLAAELQVSERTIERWRKAGMPVLASSRTRAVRFRLSEAEQWLRRSA